LGKRKSRKLRAADGIEGGAIPVRLIYAGIKKEKNTTEEENISWSVKAKRNWQSSVTATGLHDEWGEKETPEAKSSQGRQVEQERGQRHTTERVLRQKSRRSAARQS